MAMEVVSPQLRVVLVDDDDDARRALRRLFGACGCTIAEFMEAPAALMHMAQHEADLLVTDLEMPAMDGAELVERLEAVGVADVHAILEKPVSLAEVRALVTGLLAGPPAVPTASSKRATTCA